MRLFHFYIIEKLFIIVVCLFPFFASHSVFSQTTVELFDNNKNLQYFEFQYLDRLTFLNGDSITIIRDISQWQETRRKANIPAVFIYEKSNINGQPTKSYLYNYYALTDSRGLIPKYQKMYDLTSYQYAHNFICNNTISENISYNQTYNQLVIRPQPNIEQNDDSENRFELYTSSNSFSLWGDNTNVKHIEFGNSFTITCTKAQFKILNSNSFKSSALPILVANSKMSILESKHSWKYDEIMPLSSKKFDELLLSNILKYTSKIKKIDDYLYVGKWSSDIKGNIKIEDKIKSPLTRNEKKLQLILDETIKKWDKIPQYEGYFFPSQKDIKVNLNVSSNRLKTKLSYADLVGSPSSLREDKKRAISHNFKFISKQYSVKGKINKQYIHNNNLIIPKRVKSLGYFNTVWSIYPGAGVTAITRKSPYYIHHRAYKNTFLISAGSLITSMLVSNRIRNNNYARYQQSTSMSKSQEYYNRANTANKIFISSVATYSILSLIDFTFTFTIAKNNKSAQRKLNKYIKMNYQRDNTNTISLSNDKSVQSNKFHS